jgi:hypothetical protein
MKKFFLLLLLVFSLKGLSQEPTYTLSLNSGFSGCQNGNLFGCGISGDNNEIFSNDNDNNGNKIIQNVPKYTNFTLSLSSACEGEVNNTSSCSFNKFIVEKDSELIKGKFISLAGCHGRIRITGFKPNVTISKLNEPNNSTICAGSTLNLGGFPKGFPDEAYHWQYSFDGVSNWMDVSNKINVRELNNTPVTRFSIYEILGKEHEKYFDKPIYFRLGYGQDRPFTEPLAIMYNSCAPVIKNVDYKPPICNGDAVKSIEVYFDRKLDPNENLYPIYILSKNPKPKQFFQPKKPVKSLIFDPIKKLYKYSFTNLSTLVDGDSYEVVYQARMDSIPRGVLTTSSKDFTYKDPVKLTFKITKQTPPSCFGGEDGSIEIMVTSGVPLYHFYLDGVELKDQLYPTLKDGKYSIFGLKAKSNGYEIKVTDANGCIEKTTP